MVWIKQTKNQKCMDQGNSMVFFSIFFNVYNESMINVKFIIWIKWTQLLLCYYYYIFLYIFYLESWEKMKVVVFLFALHFCLFVNNNYNNNNFFFRTLLFLYSVFYKSLSHKEKTKKKCYNFFFSQTVCYLYGHD